MRGLIDGGVDLLLLETIFDTLNAKAGDRRDRERLRGAGRPPAADDLGDDHRPQRPHAVGPDARRVLHLDPRTPARSASASTARSARATCARTSPSSRASPSATSAAIRTPACPTPSASTTSCPQETGALLREFADQRLRQHRRRLLRHDARSHRGDRARRSRDCRRGRCRRLVARRPSRRRSPALLAVLRPRDADHPSRQQLPDDRRAHQRHRLGASSPG